jgi:steroid 5-alpha reductase family enzyme
MNLLSLFLLSFLLSLLCFTFTFSLALRKRNNNYIDIAYGLSYIVSSLTLSYLAISEGHFSPVSLLLCILIFIWGSRLSYRLYKRNNKKEEDFTYAKWRCLWEEHGKLYFILRSYVQIYILRAFLVSLVLLPFTLSLTILRSAHFSILLMSIGLLLWFAGFFFETVGDAELDSFHAQRKKHIQEFLTSGLFSYTRHPNYFGESLMWFAIALISIAYTKSLFCFISPLLITFLLLFVSGIPRVEKKWHGNKEWEEYAKKTSAFFPLPRKENA